jgi:CubicO group peptidase (beta-lactamase class C family)
MKRLAAGVTAFALASSPASAAAAAPFETKLRRAVTVIGAPHSGLSLAERMRHYNVTGLSVAVIDDCRLTLARGYGEAERGKKVTSATLFQAGSISKPVAAAAAMRLVDDGRLSLDRDVRTVLRGWQLPDSPHLADKAVTLRGLLSHGAGLSVHGFRGYAQGEPMPSVVQVLSGEKPANSEAVVVAQPPGSWRYSGGGYTVAQLLMTETAAEPFPQLLQRLVLKPLGMTQSSFAQPLAEARHRRAATGFHADGKPVQGKWHTYPEMAAAGLWTTPSDLSRFLLGVHHASQGKAGAFLSRAAAEAMVTTQTGIHGAGFVLSGKGHTRRFGHNGVNEGFQAESIFFPETCQGAVLMTNSDRGTFVMREVLRALADAYAWPDPMPSIERSGAAPTEAMKARFAGTYRFDDNPALRLSITPSADGLILLDPRGLQAGLLAAGDTRLFNPDDGNAFVVPPGEGPAQALRIATPGGRIIKASRIEEPAKS